MGAGIVGARRRVRGSFGRLGGDRPCGLRQMVVTTSEPLAAGLFPMVANDLLSASEGLRGLPDGRCPAVSLRLSANWLISSPVWPEPFQMIRPVMKVAMGTAKTMALMPHRPVEGEPEGGHQPEKADDWRP